MSFPSLILAISAMVSISWQAVLFQEATVCRQKAWLKGHELQTRALLHQPRPKEQFFEPTCRLLITRTERGISWLRYPNLKPHEIALQLRGRL